MNELAEALEKAEQRWFEGRAPIGMMHNAFIASELSAAGWVQREAIPTKEMWDELRRRDAIPRLGRVPDTTETPQDVEDRVLAARFGVAKAGEMRPERE